MILSKLFGGAAKKLDPQQLPQLHSFVDVTVMGRPMRSVSIEVMGPRVVVAGEVIGRAGETAIFVYQNPHGRFRFSTKITSVRNGLTRLEFPARIDTLVAGAQKRASVRMDTLVAGLWRFAPGGEGVGDFMKGSIRDISRGGCALITNRHFKIGQMLEVKLHLRSEAPLELLAEVLRAEDIATSGKISHGLCFTNVTPEKERAILEFINRRQTQLRSRGLA
ncbi:MAG TPA: PilZ domain-containing protein [Candidatus Baltobacteraceae bacterium]